MAAQLDTCREILAFIIRRPHEEGVRSPLAFYASHKVAGFTQIYTDRILHLHLALGP